MLKKVLMYLVPQWYYKFLASHIIGFAKVSRLDILTHLIEEYGQLLDEEIQKINKRMKQPILAKILFKEFME